MESLVLCPEPLCLGSTSGTSTFVFPPSSPCALSICTREFVAKGTRFLPWKGTVRTDKLPLLDALPDFDPRHRFGLYDEISDSPSGLKLRQCNWIRFLRYSLVYTEAVNVIGSRGLPNGEPIFDLIKDVEPSSELVCFFVPERPEEALLLPAIQYLRHTLLKRIIDNVLEESPIDLSSSLVHNNENSNEGSESNIKSESSKEKNNNIDKSENSNNNKVHHKCVEERLEVSKNEEQEEEEDNCSSSAGSLSVVRQNSHVSTRLKSFSVASLTSNSESKPNSTAVKTNLGTTRKREKHMLPCHFCGKAFDRPSLLKRHIRIHTGERPHVCDICGKGFSTSSSLNTHRRIHSGEKPHQCNICGKRFTASSNLYYHKMTHIKEKPHKCTMCSKSFPTPGDLKSHMYVHTGTWPFKCHVCHRGFSKQTNLKNHMLLHSGDKPFDCEVCGKKFALACNLRAHVKTHHARTDDDVDFFHKTIDMLGDNNNNEDNEDNLDAIKTGKIGVKV